MILVMVSSEKLDYLEEIIIIQPHSPNICLKIVKMTCSAECTGVQMIFYQIFVEGKGLIRSRERQNEINSIILNTKILILNTNTNPHSLILVLWFECKNLEREGGGDCCTTRCFKGYSFSVLEFFGHPCMYIKVNLSWASIINYKNMHFLTGFQILKCFLMQTFFLHIFIC